jgi:hypothetical protein
MRRSFARAESTPKFRLNADLLEKLGMPQLTPAALLGRPATLSRQWSALLISEDSQ